MTNKHLPFVALAVTAIAVSCSTDDLTEQEQYPTEGKTVTLTASVDGNRTRVGMTKSEDGTTASFYWHKDDKILVQTKKSDGTYSGAEFSTTETATGAASATFTGEVIGTVGQYAVYPYNESHKFTDEKTLTYNLPASYTYTTVGSNIFSKEGETGITYPSNSTNMPMLGTIADGTISFKHIGGLAVIRIDKMPAESGTLTVTADKQISGNFVVDLSAETPVIATASTETETDKQVVFTFYNAETDKPGVFYLPLPTGRYFGIKIALSYGETTQTIPYSLNASSANVYAISLTTDSKGNLRSIQSLGSNRYMINGHAFVDLGLSVLWAETNVGAAVATTIGPHYFFFGCLVPNTWFNTYNSPEMYDSTTKVLKPAYDVATVKWGAGCRMPTLGEYCELLMDDVCAWTLTAENGIAGARVSGKQSGYTDQSIFLSCSGRSTGEYLETDSKIYGFYWSSTIYGNTDSYMLQFYYRGGTRRIVWDSVGYGCTIRPVAERP